MENQIGHEGHAETFSNKDSDQQGVLSRRKFLAGLGAAATAVGVGGGTVKLLGGSGEAPSQEHVPVDYSISAAEAEANIDQLVMPDLYEDRPWADPEQLIGLTAEELREFAAVPITAETRTDEGFAKVFGQKLELIANAGRTLEDVRRARELGYPVGEKDDNGNKLGVYENYVKTEYLDSMFDGLFTIKYDDPEVAEAEEGLKNYLVGYADNFEAALSREEWRKAATLFVNTGMVEAGPSAMYYERSLFIPIETRRPKIEGGYDSDKDVVYRGDLIVNANEGTDGSYEIGIQSLNLTRM